MKKLIVSLAAVSALLALSLTAPLWAQNAPASSASDLRLVHVATLNSIAANQEFQKNVRFMQGQREQVVVLKSQLESATSNADRIAIEQQYAEAYKQLNANNQQMLDTYGFTLNRNYTMVVEKAHVYMYVTDQELEQIRAAQGNQNSTTNRRR